MDKRYFVYLLTNQRNTVIYTGVTSDLVKRIFQHKAKLVDGFSKRYNLEKLVYYEIFEDPEAAISREKQIKSGSRAKKEQLITAENSNWSDLFYGLL